MEYQERLSRLDKGGSRVLMPALSLKRSAILMASWILLIAGTTQPSPDKIGSVIHLSGPVVSLSLDVAKYLGMLIVVAFGAKLVRSSLMWPSFIFVSLMAVSILVSVDVAHSALIVAMMCLTLYISMKFGSSLGVGPLIVGAVIGLLLVLVPSLFLLRETIYAPVTGVFGTRNELARITSYCAGLSFVALWIVPNKGTRLFGVGAFLFSAGFCIYTGSATALTTLLLFLFVFMLVMSVKLPLGPVSVAAITFLAGIVLLIAPASYSLFFALTGRDLTFTGRTDIWEFAWKAVGDRPILGHGVEAFWSSSAGIQGRVTLGDAAVHSHNTWIELFLSLGVIGGTFAVLALLLQVIKLLRAIPIGRNHNNLELAVFSAITMVTVMYGFSEHAAYRPFYSLVFVYLSISIALTKVSR